jgi:hypothetical protein
LTEIGTDFLVYPVVIRAGKDKPAANAAGLTVGTGSADRSGRQRFNDSGGGVGWIGGVAVLINDGGYFTTGNSW